MARVIAAASPDRSSRLLIAAAIIFAGLAAVLVFVGLNDGSEKASPSATSAEVVVAAQGISANTKLTADLLELRAVPLDQKLDGVYGDVQPLVGLPLRFPVAEGEQITPLKVGAEAVDDKQDLAFVLQASERGFSVEVTEVSSVGGLLLPGNFVDVIAVGDQQLDGAIEAFTILQNIEVLSVAQEAQEPLPAASAAAQESENGGGLRGQRPDDVERQPKARTVTLAVTPEQAQLLALAQATGGQLWLSLRSAGDHDTISIGATGLPDTDLSATP